MDWFWSRASTIAEALTLRRVIAIPIAVTVITVVVRGSAALSEYFTTRNGHMLLGIPSWVYGIFAGLLLLLYFVGEYATRLRLQIAPCLNVSFDQNGMGMVLAVHRSTSPTPTSGTERESRSSYVRIRIDALSKTTVHGCSAFIIALEKRLKTAAAFTPISLPEPVSLREQQFDVVPQVPSMVDFLMSGEWDNKLVPVSYWPFILRDAFNDQAIYRFTFVVNGNGASERKQIDVNWEGKWDSITATEVPSPK